MPNYSPSNLKFIRKFFSLSLIIILSFLNLSLFSLNTFANETGDRIIVEAGLTLDDIRSSDLNLREECQNQTAIWYTYNSMDMATSNPNLFSYHDLYNNEAVNESFNIPSTLNVPEGYLSPENEKLLIDSSAIIDFVPGCCYAFERDLIYDDDFDCELNPIEACNQLKDLAIEQRNEECQAALDDPNTGLESAQAICSISFSCQEGDLVPTDPKDFTPHSSEYFHINDPEKGLTTDNQGSSFYDNTEQGPIFSAINQGISILVGLVSTVAFAILIIGAYLLITSNGDENRIDKGKNSIKYALLGIIFVLLSFTIVRLVQSILF